LPVVAVIAFVSSANSMVRGAARVWTASTLGGAPR
jgi:hypothetical protein